MILKSSTKVLESSTKVISFAGNCLEKVQRNVFLMSMSGRQHGKRLGQSKGRDYE